MNNSTRTLVDFAARAGLLLLVAAIIITVAIINPAGSSDRGKVTTSATADRSSRAPDETGSAQQPERCFYPPSRWARCPNRLQPRSELVERPENKAAPQ